MSQAPIQAHPSGHVQLPSTSLWLLLGWIMGRYRRIRVSGQSMAPTLCDGQTVLVDQRVYRRRSPAVGEIVLARHPYRADLLLLKRIQAIDDQGRLDLRGDNPAESTDSAVFGTLAPERLLGLVVARMS